MELPLSRSVVTKILSEENWSTGIATKRLIYFLFLLVTELFANLLNFLNLVFHQNYIFCAPPD